MAPLRTIGTATQEVPTTMMGMASRQLRPTAMTEEAVSQVPRLIVSVAQYAIQVHKVHVWYLGGTGSISALVLHLRSVSRLLQAVCSIRADLPHILGRKSRILSSISDLVTGKSGEMATLLLKLPCLQRG